MLFLWVKVLHQNIFSLHFACKICFFLKIQHQNIFQEKTIAYPPPSQTPFQVKRSVPKTYSNVFEITFVAIRMESYHILSLIVQVIINSLSINPMIIYLMQQIKYKLSNLVLKFV